MYPINMCHLNLFNKMFIGKYPGRMYRCGDQTKDDEREKGRVKNHQSEAEGTGDELAMLIKVLTHSTA